MEKITPSQAIFSLRIWWILVQNGGNTSSKRKSTDQCGTPILCFPTKFAELVPILVIQFVVRIATLDNLLDDFVVLYSFWKWKYTSSTFKLQWNVRTSCWCSIMSCITENNSLLGAECLWHFESLYILKTTMYKSIHAHITFSEYVKVTKQSINKKHTINLQTMIY